MRSLLFTVFLTLTVGLLAQNPAPSTSAPANSQSPDPAASKAPAQRTPNLAPPRSDRVNVEDLDVGDGQSSSKDTQIDLTPEDDDAKAHPQGSDVPTNSESAPENGDIKEFHPWDPHKAAKDIEVGDFYFKKKNYAAAESRYREALYYKDNDALATYRLAICLEKLDRASEAQAAYENYLKILPHGPQAEDARKAIDRLKSAASKAAK